MQTAIRNDTLQFDPELHRPRPHRSGPASGEATDHGMLADDSTAMSCCPYFERNDERCQARFSLARLSEAMDVCLGSGVAGCLMYHRLRMEEEQGVVFAHSPAPAPVTLTHDGDSLRLRPTGS
jgi:hypothetical protein